MKTMVEQFCTSIRLNQRPASLQFTEFSKDLIAGTYQLDSSSTASKGGTSREGGLYVVGADNNGLQIKQETIFPGGVFRFELNEKEERLVAALSNGHLALLRVQKERNNLFCLQSDIPVCDAGMLLNCSARKNQVLCTNNLGQFFITNIDRGETEVIVDAHSSRYGLPECEVWSCAWLGTETLITGAEDANLKIWDLRSSNSAPQNVDGKSHSAGIISIVKCRRRGAECFLTGSYDDHLRLFDLRLFGRPVSELKLNGGPWDAKPIGEECFVVSCMYGGWSIVRQTANSTLALVHCHPKNGSNLLYGADAERIIGTDGEHSQIYRVASCTFNDSKVHMERISFGDEINLL